jgi:K+-transporting ATPase ATPase C chain
MMNEIRPAIMMLFVLTLITGLAYPLAMTGIAETLFPKNAGGSLIERDGKVVGSALIGQEFKSDRYFHGRPSATLGPDPADPSKSVVQPYNAANSMGSNLGPTNRALATRVEEDVNRLKQENPNMPVPIDLVTTTASGLDPDISPEAASAPAHRGACRAAYPGRAGGAASQCAAAEPGARSGDELTRNPVSQTVEGDG